MITLYALKWVPDFAQGLVRDLRVRWALEEAGIPYGTTLSARTTGTRPRTGTWSRERMPELSVRNPTVRPGMVRLHMLDYASGFDL